MKRYLAPAACAAAILLSSVSVDAILAPVAAQQVDFDSFHDYLANYGDWVYSDRWGEVWVPENVSDDFQPYGTNGYWAASDDYGWIWVSNYEWGDVPFHYGRWVNDPDIGWLWIPGYVWSPAWVAWRHNGNYVGWMPMPPDREFLGRSNGPSIGFGISLGHGINIGINFNDTSSYYGYSEWYPGYDERRFARNWVFVPTRHLADRDYHRYSAPSGNNVTIIRNTTNITNYTVVNNYVVNRGIDVNLVERAGGRPVEHVRLDQVIKHPQFVAKADAGVQIQTRMRQESPRGTGEANSAPKPSDKLVQGLSDKVPEHQGHAPTHVFTKQTVTQAPAFTGKTTPSGGTPPGSMNGPGGNMNGPAMTHDHKPGETGGAPSGQEGAGTRGGTMNGPAGNTTGGTHMHDESKPAETGSAPAGGGGMMMHKHDNTGSGTPGGENAPMNAPANAPAMEHHHDTTGGGMTGGAPTNGPTPMMQHRDNTGAGPAPMNGPTNAPTMEHHHDNTGGGGAPMNGPAPTPMMQHRDNTGGGMTGGAPMNGPAPTPMMHRHDNTGGAPGGESIGAGGPPRDMERKPPVTTQPVEHAVTPHNNPPTEHAPPQKGDDKDKKDKPQH